MHGGNLHPAGTRSQSETMYQNCCGPSIGRRYLTREEKVDMLKEYAEELEAELTGVKERLAELQKGSV
ncbi:MAG: hypothetical protein ACYDDF_14075 [Thermoplasmatota archaeon]